MVGRHVLKGFAGGDELIAPRTHIVVFICEQLKRGAIAQSYNPFYNNVMALGTNDADMALAANTVDELGGACADLEHDVLWRGAAVQVPRMNSWISCSVSTPSLFASIALKIRSWAA